MPELDTTSYLPVVADGAERDPTRAIANVFIADASANGTPMVAIANVPIQHGQVRIILSHLNCW